MAFDFNRRSLILSGAALSAMAGTSLLGGCESLLQKIQNRPTRRGTQSLSSTDPVWSVYRAAVSAMQARQAGDARNWTEQARIHLDHCPHGNWFFLPWHRAYLFYFEQICRELSGDDGFALPYWNWNQNRSIPAPFWSGVLNHPRSVNSSSTLPDSWVGDTVLNNILALTNFTQFASGPSTTQRGFSFSGSLEATPHNNVHGWTGGDMGTYWSPLDPIFWLHHCMIDCMWWHWNADLGNPNTNDPGWSNFTFSNNFVDGNGNPVDIQVISTVLMPLLSYRYEPCQIGGDTMLEMARRDVADARRLREFLEAGAEVPTRLDDSVVLDRGLVAMIGEPVRSELVIPAELARQALDGRAPHLVAELEGVRPPADESFFVRVFLNLPEANAQTSTDSPHYAGSFGFFEDPDAHAGHDAGRAFRVDLTPGLRRLSQAGRLGNAVAIQLVAVPMPGREPVAAPAMPIQAVRAGLLPAVRTRFDERE
ncbi:hypothetical protein E5163_07745 [Marinicauda algicola]|uniref:Tyrosinase copper-binding domain-containing protein n=1 Tax=Marinicauda algicola TaxID=2029849 RepID=A0A4S2H0H1_9PROT|nr:tyrosinase family protein [Marinicauda algicola]TGY89015.1 hypothetical protein E5163_07745 [Marinicauda algicola]